MAKFRILSLDGGGILGCFGASYLAEIESTLGIAPIGRYFDLIAGTSTGGIIATALALGEPASRVRDFYRSDGQQIFTRLPRAKLPEIGFPGNIMARVARGRVNEILNGFGIDLDYLLQSKYGNENLTKSLKEFFGNRTIADAQTSRLIVPAVDLIRGDTVAFKTPHLPGRNSRDPKLLARDVVLATTAAPTYFPHAVIGTGSAYCDGGLWANNPGMVAYVEAMKIRDDCKREDDACFESADVVMLSIGTGTVAQSLRPPDASAGLGYWGPQLVEWLMLSQAQGVQHQLEYMLGERLHRANFPVPDKKTWAMDSVERMDDLFHLGPQRAHADLAKLRKIFFEEPAKKFSPFKE